MTRGKAAGLAVAASVAATSILWFGLIVVSKRVGPQKYHSSDVGPPMSLVIRDLVETADAGRHHDLKRKLVVLSTRWEAFVRGGDEPSLFWSDIVAVEKTANPDGAEPPDGTGAATPSEGEGRETE